MVCPGPLWFAGIDLSRFNLTGADLTGSNPRDAQVSPEQLESAELLEDAIMPDGKKYDESSRVIPSKEDQDQE